MAAKRKTAKNDYEPLHWQDAPDLLSISQAARLVSAHRNTIDKWMKNGRVPFTHVGTHRRIKKHDLAKAVGLTLDSAGRIATDDGTLLASYAKRFDAAIARLRQAQDAGGEALVEIKAIVSDMKREGR